MLLVQPLIVHHICQAGWHGAGGISTIRLSTSADQRAGVLFVTARIAARFPGMLGWLKTKPSVAEG
jgi:hypothetical protein